MKKTLPLICYFCGGKLRTDNGWFEIYDQELPPFRAKPRVRFNRHHGREEYGSLAYPGNGEALVSEGRWNRFQPVVVFAHTECGPDIGYNFSFDRLNEDWDKHLRGKVWFSLAIPDALRTARSAMAQITAKK